MKIELLRVVAACAVCAALAVPTAARADALAAAGGRYVFGQLGVVRADQYMLDTQTGQVWQLVCRVPHVDAKTKKASPSQCDESFFQHVGYETSEANQLSAYPWPRDAPGSK